ncbi:MAG: UMP kinase [Nanoarchaeota archaeon]
MKTIVFSLGGSLIVPGKIDTDFLKKFRKFVRRLDGYRVIIVTGGGALCRKYNDAAKTICSPTDYELDKMGIAATKINAELVRLLFEEEAYENIVSDPTKEIHTDKRIIVASGYKPGNSSDKVAVMLGIKFNAESVVNMTNIDVVYDSDPKENPGASPLDNVSWEEFLEITGTEWKPGKNVPFDPVASQLAKENNISVVIINGKDLENLENCINGKDFKGTLIGASKEAKN